MGDYWFGGDAEKAEKLLHKKPAKFYRILTWANAEAEAKPILQQRADAKAKADEDHKTAANKFPRQKRAPVEPSTDPADDAGDAFVE